MKKTTKGSLAAASAALLLLGGVGSLAYWTDAQDAPGTDIASGHLKLGTPDCDGWTLDGGTAYTSAVLLVPGDTLTQVCSTTVDADGEHLAANFDVTDPEFTVDNAMTDELTADAGYTVNGTPADPSAGAVDISDGDVVEVTITIDWPYGVVDNDSNVQTGLSSALDDITITATQTHDPS